MLMAQDAETAVRAATLSGLATIADNSSRWASLVAQLVNDPDPMVRQCVAVVARHLAPNEVDDLLHRLAEDPEAIGAPGRHDPTRALAPGTANLRHAWPRR
jgi:hypothetical protein